jgi:hypothetical protein
MNWLRRLYVSWRDRHDPAWAACGIKPPRELGYDEAQAVKAAKRAQTRSATGRRLPKPIKAEPSNVVPMRQRKASGR